MNCCPHCNGTGFAPAPTSADLSALAAALLAACEAAGDPVLADGTVRAATAAILVDLAPKTLANMRSNGEGPAYIEKRKRVFYRLTDLARWLDQRSNG